MVELKWITREIWRQVGPQISYYNSRNNQSVLMRNRGRKWGLLCHWDWQSLSVIRATLCHGALNHIALVALFGFNLISQWVDLDQHKKTQTNHSKGSIDIDCECWGVRTYKKWKFRKFFKINIKSPQCPQSPQDEWSQKIQSQSEVSWQGVRVAAVNRRWLQHQQSVWCQNNF